MASRHLSMIGGRLVVEELEGGRVIDKRSYKLAGVGESLPNGALLVAEVVVLGIGTVIRGHRNEVRESVVLAVQPDGNSGGPYVTWRRSVTLTETATGGDQLHDVTFWGHRVLTLSEALDDLEERVARHSDNPLTGCTVHAAGECFEGCEHAYPVEEELVDGDRCPCGGTIVDGHCNTSGVRTVSPIAASIGVPVPVASVGEKRYAVVTGAKSKAEVAAYLPGNYSVAADEPYHPGDGYLIEGVDNAGWTLDDYVIPRFASGSMGCREMFLHVEDDGDAENGPHVSMHLEDTPQRARA